ncbi:subclass B3 metallo-beta-lactamase [Sphingosinicella rhizophila]|uniref:Subclass B3 metallo-beta-lactamase n=1 Tax=Sphingosinicella rhizophila TaxID=3050082 RepID=A0ABU3Q267_9SPHN|nr:subclass B3 metallo-beta-lactamase [Sphingosinicella sp. GR2756]MDT9597502.1 subclass B3 metallo-beta-lactamase [Sphingosinicella sp. GR2756]
MSRFSVPFFLALISAPAAAQPEDVSKLRAEWNRSTEPFRLVGNVYYVGTEGLAAFLITGPEGHVLIDGALEESAPQIAANIRRLGFRIEDVDILLINHAHWDHSGGLAELKRLSGAKLLASAADKPALESGVPRYRPDMSPSAPVKVDAIISDGSRIAVGRTSLVTHLTPGHTRGCTSWTMRIEEKGKLLDLVFACSLTVAGQKLVGDSLYPEAAADFRATYSKLKRLQADVYLTYHPAFFDMDAKRRRLAEGDADAFVDSGELARRVQRAETEFKAELHRQQREASQ